MAVSAVLRWISGIQGRSYLFDLLSDAVPVEARVGCVCEELHNHQRLLFRMHDLVSGLGDEQQILVMPGAEAHFDKR